MIDSVQEGARLRIIARKTLKQFWLQHPAAEGPLEAWFAEAEIADWKSPAEIRAKFGSASFVGDRVVFNVGGNKFRLVVKVNYQYRIVYIRFIGTHNEYDKIDVEKA